MNCATSTNNFVRSHGQLNPASKLSVGGCATAPEGAMISDFLALFLRSNFIPPIISQLRNLHDS